MSKEKREILEETPPPFGIQDGEEQCPCPPRKRKRKRVSDIHSLVTVSDVYGTWLVTDTFSTADDVPTARLVRVVMANTTPYKELFGRNDMLVVSNSGMNVDVESLRSFSDPEYGIISPSIGTKISDEDTPVRPFLYNHDTQTLKLSKTLSESFKNDPQQQFV